MPIYEYTCRKCNAQIEVIQKVSDKPLARHAGCGGKLEKEWSRTGLQFKGSGWYVTDYAGQKSEAKEGKESKDGKESKEAAPSAKGESSTADAGKTAGGEGGGDASKGDKGKAKASAAGA